MSYPQILQLSSAGTPVRWIDYQEAAIYYAKDQIAWELGEDDFYTLFGGTNRVSGQQSAIRVRPIIAVRKLEHTGNAERVRMVPRLTNRNLFNRDKHRCAYCMSYASVLTRDHIIPVSRGGKDNWMNVVTACKPCNNIKGARTPDEAGMELGYVPYTPSHAENLLLTNRKMVDSQREFLRPLVGQHSRVFSD
jgi:HNH endonuclease